MRRKRKNNNVSGEPVFSEEIKYFELAKHYNYYRTNFSEKDAKQFLIDYVSCQKKKSIINSQSYIPLSMCWTARMLSNNNKLPETVVSKFNAFIDNLKYEKRKVVVNDALPPVSIEKKNQNKINDAYSLLESMIDKLFDSKGKDTISAEGVIMMYGLNKNHATSIAESLENEHIKDFREIADDEDLQEAYSFLTKRQQNLIFKNLKQLKEEFLSVKTVVDSDKKKKRAVKLKPVAELIKNIKFKNEVYGLPSVEIKHLLGKRVAYLVSDVKRTIIRLESKSGFETRSSFLINVDSAEKIIVYGKNQESAATYLASAKNEKAAKDLKKHVQVRRFEPIEIKNNEYRTTDKFCVIKDHLNL